MLKQLIGDRTKKRTSSESVDRLLSLQLDEIEELSALLMKRIDDRVNALKEMEAVIDQKMKELRKLIQRAEEITEDHQVDFADYRIREVMVLASRGLKVEEIASILDLPSGEIELILAMQE